MKRFQLWLTTAIMFSLPALVFAQATGGSPGKQGKLIKNGTAAGTGRKGTVEPEGNAPKTTGTTTPPPKRETQPARFIEKVAVPAGKAELSKPTAAKKGSNAPEAPRSKGN